MPLLRTLMMERPDLRHSIVSRAKAWAEGQSWPNAVRAWEQVFDQQLETLSKVDAPSWVQLDRADPTGEPERCGSSIQAGLQVLFGWLTGSIWLLVVTWRGRRQAVAHSDAEAEPPPDSAPASATSGSSRAR